MRRDSKPIAAFDLDGTLFKSDLVEEHRRECVTLRIFSKKISTRIEQLLRRRELNQIAYNNATKEIIQLYLSAIKGMNRGLYKKAALNVARRQNEKVFLFTRSLLKILQPTHECIAITGSFTDAVTPFTKRWKFSSVYGTELLCDHKERYTGKCGEIPMYEKGAALKSHAQKTNKTLKESIAIGDTVWDIPMLNTAAWAIVFNPDYTLMNHAVKEGIPIVIEQKNIITVIQHGGRIITIFSPEEAQKAVKHVLSSFKRS